LFKELDTGELEKAGFVKFDALDVDECQDFTEAHLLLFSSLVKDVSTITMAGDRTQTIAKGVGFRFAALASMLWTLSKKQHNNRSHQQAETVEVTQLVRNYRCHSGILGVSNLIQRILLQTLFPGLVDQADAERSYFSGPRPILIENVEWRDLVRFLKSDNQKLDFGADTVFLVRDNMAREKLKR
jgi:hypothetical protein